MVTCTGWPSDQATHTGDGLVWLTPTDRQLNRHRPDSWRVEEDLIRENWDMVGMVDMYRRLGVDVLVRMAERGVTGVIGGDAA